MKERLLKLLACPTCGGEIILDDGAELEGAEIIAGQLNCADCSRRYPIVRGVPRFADLAEIDEEIVMTALGKPKYGKAQCFEDQYISTGGQLYELMCGHDRFIADLRPLMSDVMRERGFELSICCHPYDLCTEMIARELGVIVVNESGDQLNAPLSVDGNVSWMGYANRDVRQQIEPVLQNSLKKRGLLN